MTERARICQPELFVPGESMDSSFRSAEGGLVLDRDGEVAVAERAAELARCAVPGEAGGQRDLGAFEATGRAEVTELACASGDVVEEDGSSAASGAKPLTTSWS